MKLFTFPRTLGFAAITATAVLSFAGGASAGELSYTTRCGPDGSTIVVIKATDHVVPRFNGNPGVEIPGASPELRTFDYTTGPGTVEVIWYGPGANPQDGIVEWGRKSITVPARTDCVPAETTTTAPPTTIATVTTPPPAIDQATTVPVTIPPQQTSACEQERDEGNDICNLGTRPPAIDQGQELPATGRNTGEVLVVAGAFTLAGLIALRLRRYGRARSALGA